MEIQKINIIEINNLTKNKYLTLEYIIIMQDTKQKKMKIKGVTYIIDATLSPAEKAYIKTRENIAKYQIKNPDKVKNNTLKYTEKMKSNPENHKIILDKRKKYYHDVLKPKKLELKNNLPSIF